MKERISSSYTKHYGWSQALLGLGMIAGVTWLSFQMVWGLVLLIFFIYLFVRVIWVAFLIEEVWKTKNGLIGSRTGEIPWESIRSITRKLLPKGQPVLVRYQAPNGTMRKCYFLPSYRRFMEAGNKWEHLIVEELKQRCQIRGRVMEKTEEFSGPLIAIVVAWIGIILGICSWIFISKGVGLLGSSASLSSSKAPVRIQEERILVEVLENGSVTFGGIHVSLTELKEKMIQSKIKRVLLRAHQRVDYREVSAIMEILGAGGASITFSVSPQSVENAGKTD